MNSLYNHLSQFKKYPHPSTRPEDDPQVFYWIEKYGPYRLAEKFVMFKILWFLVYLTILALIAVSLMFFTLICAAIV